MLLCMYECMYICLHVCIYVCTYTHTHTSHAVPSEPCGGEGVPVINNTTYACPKLNLHDVEVGGEVPLGHALTVVAAEPQAGTVVDALAQKPYEVVARTYPHNIQVVEEKSIGLGVLWVWSEEGVWLVEDVRSYDVCLCTRAPLFNPIV